MARSPSKSSLPTTPLHEQALDHTFPHWNDLAHARGATRRYNRAQLRTAWGAQHLQRVGLVSDGTLLASAKRYRVRRASRRPHVDTIGIGAVFTPPEHPRARPCGRSHRAHRGSRARADGAAMAMLFSEIAPRYYERLGFSVVPMQQALVGVRVEAGCAGGARARRASRATSI